MTTVDVALKMPTGTIDALINVDAFADEELLLGSKIGWKSNDKSLKALLYVGRQEDFKVDPEDRLLGRAKRLAPSFLRYFGLYGLSGVTSTAMRENAPNLGELIAKAGETYGAVKMGLRVYDEWHITGFTTLKLIPVEGSSPSIDQVNVYRSLVERYLADKR